MKAAIVISVLVGMFCFVPVFADEGGDESRASSAERDQTEEDLLYAEKLRELGLDDLADIFTDTIPDSNDKAVVLAKFQAYMHQHFKDERKIDEYIQSKAGDDGELYWLMKIRLADAYWAHGKPEECFKIYEDFMKFYKDLSARAAKE
jgi:hypothetical protein